MLVVVLSVLSIAEQWRYNMVGNLVVDNTQLVGVHGSPVTVQTPIPTDGDSVYSKDVWVEESLTTDWVNLDDSTEEILVPFTNLHTAISNSTTDNPKAIRVHFNRTVSLNQVGMGCVKAGKSFSNVKITMLGSGGVSRTALDDSANNTKYTSRDYVFGPELANAVLIQFYTTDEVVISNITIQKITKTASRLEALTDDDVVVDIGATRSKNLKVTDAENGLAIAKGDVEGTSFNHKFGTAPDFDYGNGEVSIWDGAEDGEPYEQMNYVFSTGSGIDSISAEDAADTQDVVIQGLDGDWHELSQTVTLNGQTRVALTTPLRRVYRAFNDDNTDLTGHVFIYEDVALSGGVPTDSTLIRAVIHPENNQTEMAIYTVPVGYTGYMRSWYCSSAGASKSTNYIVRIKSRLPDKVFRLKHRMAWDGTIPYQHQYVEPEVFTEKTDIIMSAEITAGGVSSAAISAGFDIVIVENV